MTHLNYEEFCKAAKCKMNTDEDCIAYSHYCLQQNELFPKDLRFDYIKNIEDPNWKENLVQVFNSPLLKQYIELSIPNLKDLVRYLSARPRVKLACKRICEEVYEMKYAWKDDKFAPSVHELDGLNDSDFVKVYLDKFDKTTQHEGAEAVEELCLFFEAHDVDILDYLRYLERFRKIMNETPTTSISSKLKYQPKANDRIIVVS